VREGLIEDIAARVHPEPRAPRGVPAEAPADESLHAAEADSAETG
jgi:hypothetical protein